MGGWKKYEIIFGILWGDRVCVWLDSTIFQKNKYKKDKIWRIYEFYYILVYILLTIQGRMQIFLLRPTLFLYIVTFWVLKNTADCVPYTPLSGTHQAYIFADFLSQLLTVWAQGWVWLQSFYLQAPSRYDVSHVFTCKFLTKILQ